MNHDDKYLEFAEIFIELSELKSKLDNKIRLLQDLKDCFRNAKGPYGLELSAHAIANISTRLEVLAHENSHIYKDIMNRENPNKSLIWGSNMKAFIIGILANANKKGEYKEYPSKSNNGNKEYHFRFEINKWSTNDKKLIFVGIVESNVIKTGYFNWEEKR